MKFPKLLNYADIVKESNTCFAQLLEQKTQKKGGERQTNLVTRLIRIYDGREHWKEEGT